MNQLPTFKKIGRFAVEGLIVRGSLSLLYLASDPDTSAPLIIKVLSPNYLSDKDVVERFLNEARIISLADHPNIVHLRESGTWEGGLFIAMEFVKGRSLKKIFQHQPYTLKRAMDVLLQIAYAVSHLHAHGIVHGDLKPENILINEHGIVKVIDFGIARLLTEEKKEHALRFLGTPIYMAPELGLKPDTMSFQSDIFALGIIAYELAVGKISHGRVHLSFAPKGLQKLLQKALQPHPEERYRDMCDFIGDLSSYIKSPEIEKDIQGSDKFLEIFEKLEEIQTSLLPKELPAWADLAYSEGVGLSGLYIDFFDIDESTKVVFVCVSNRKDIQGLINASMVKASLRTLIEEKNLNPERVQIAEEMSFCYLTINTKERKVLTYQNGFGALSGVDKQGHFQKGEKLLLIANEQPEQMIIGGQNADSILRKLKIATDEELLFAILLDFG